MRFLFLLLLLSSCSSSKQKLHLFCWGDFIAQEIIEEFEKTHNCQVLIDTYDSNEAMFAKLKAGSAGYDLVFPTKYFISFLSHEDLIEPFNEDLLPNYVHIDWKRLNFFHFETSAYYIPYMLSYTGIGYRKDKLVPPPDSWSVFNEERYHKRMTLLADFRETIGAALLYLGYSVNTLDEKELEEASLVIREWKKNIAKFENEQYLNGLASSEYYASHGYGTYIAQLMLENDQVSFVLPKEGGIITLDTIALLKGAPNSPLAHAFVNTLLDPKNAELNMEKVQAIPPLHRFLNRKGDNPALYPPEEMIQKSQVIEDLGEGVTLYQDLWEKIIRS